jgi:hypothetical protein
MHLLGAHRQRGQQGPGVQVIAVIWMVLAGEQVQLVIIGQLGQSEGLLQVAGRWIDAGPETGYERLVCRHVDFLPLVIFIMIQL